MLIFHVGAEITVESVKKAEVLLEQPHGQCLIKCFRLNIINTGLGLFSVFPLMQGYHSYSNILETLCP